MPLVQRKLTRQELESQTESKIVKALQKKGWVSYKFGKKGEEDRLFIRPAVDGAPARYVWLEIKRDGQGGVPDRLQQYKIEQKRRMGLESYCVDSAEDAIKLMGI